MLLPCLFLCLLVNGNLQPNAQVSATPESGSKPAAQSDSSSIAISCEEVLNRALSLHESFKNAVSAGGRRALELEAENYYTTVLLKKISGCTATASMQSNAVLSKLLFELAYSYADSGDKVIPIELARLYLNAPELAKTILVEYEKGKRHELIEILRWALDSLHEGNAEEISRLKQALHELELK